MVLRYGLTDSSSKNNQQLFLQHDFKLVNDLFKLIDLSDLTNVSLRIIGKYEDNKIRPLCYLEFSKRSFYCHKQSECLPEGVKDSTDKSRLQQRAFKQLRDTLNEHNNNYPDDALPNNITRDPKNSIVNLHSQNNKLIAIISPSITKM